MTLKKFFSLLCCMAIAAHALADSKIKFEVLTHDFGTIQETDGDADCVFEFTNEGDTPLLITRAQASCGCTSPEYPKKPIRPGEKGEIKVTYHAKGRPGPFEKSVYVYSNDKANERVMLTITGNVVNSGEKILTYTEQLGGGIRVKTTALNFFDVYPGRPNRTRALMVYNESDAPVMLTFRNAPKHLDITMDPEIIQPKNEGRINVTYVTDKVKDWGPKKDMFDIFVKGKETKMKNNHILIMADIWEDFSKLEPEDMQVAPELSLNNVVLGFGKDQPRSQEITLLNEGKQNLVIRKIMNDQEKIFQTKLADTVIKPGETTKLTVTYNAAQVDPKTNSYHITIISNDPRNSRVLINLQIMK